MEVCTKVPGDTDGGKLTVLGPFTVLFVVAWTVVAALVGATVAVVRRNLWHVCHSIERRWWERNLCKIQGERGLQ